MFRESVITIVIIVACIFLTMGMLRSILNENENGVLLGTICLIMLVDFIRGD